MGHFMKQRDGSIDLTHWGLVAINVATRQIDRALRRAVSEALAYALKDDMTFVAFDLQRPHSLNLDLFIALNTDDKDPMYSFNLRKISTAYMAECRADGSWSDELAQLANALRTLADEIDRSRHAWSKKEKRNATS